MFRVLKYAIFITLTFLLFFWVIKNPGVAVFEWFGFRIETNIVFCVLLVTIITILVKILFNISFVKFFQKYNIYQYVFLEGKTLGVSTSEMIEMLSVLEKSKNSYKYIRNIFIAKKLAKKNKGKEALKIIRKMEKIAYLKPLYYLNFALFNTKDHNDGILSFAKALKQNKSFIDNSKNVFNLIIKENIVERFEQCIKILEKSKDLSLENQRVLYKLQILQVEHLILRDGNIDKAKKLTFDLVKHYPQFLEGYDIIREHFDDASFVNEQMLNAISDYDNCETITIVNNFLKNNTSYANTKELLDKRKNKQNSNMLVFTKARLAIKNKKYNEAEEMATKIENLYHKKLILAEIKAEQGFISEAFEVIAS